MKLEAKVMLAGGSPRDVVLQEQGSWMRIMRNEVKMVCRGEARRQTGKVWRDGRCEDVELCTSNLYVISTEVDTSKSPKICRTHV